MPDDDVRVKISIHMSLTGALIIDGLKLLEIEFNKAWNQIFTR